MSISMTVEEYQRRCRDNLRCELEHARRKVIWWQAQVAQIEAMMDEAVDHSHGSRKVQA